VIPGVGGNGAADGPSRAGRRQRRRWPERNRVTMYTARKTELGRLKGYHAALTGMYVAAMRQRRHAAARAILDRRARVKRAILIQQEWAVTGPAALDVDELLSGLS
jgi:hypothetical protein